MSVAGYQRARAATSADDSGTSTTGNTAPSLELIRTALRIDDYSEEDERLQQIAEAAVTFANRQAPDAPAAVAREAMLRFIGWAWEGPSASAGFDESGAWHRSGAKGLLSRWQVRRGGVIG